MIWGCLGKWKDISYRQESVLAVGIRKGFFKGKTVATMFPQRPQSGQSSESSRGHGEMILDLALKLNSSQGIKEFFCFLSLSPFFPIQATGA